jgi:hypothetical protein
MKKIGLLCLAVVLALGSMGFAYAMWYEDLFIEGTVQTGELDWEFDCGTVTVGDPCDPATIDKQCGDLFTNPTPVSTGKNVGCTDVICLDTDKDGDVDTLQVILYNTYPGYYVHIGYYVHNNGTIPLHFEEATISDCDDETYVFYAIPCVVSFDGDEDGDLDFDVRFGDNFNAQVHPCESIDQSFDVHVRQQAEQGATYCFEIKLRAVQYNEPYPP